MNESKNSPHWAEITTVGLTLAIVIVGIIQAFIYHQQKILTEHLGQSSGQQTGQLIAAANIQADAATKNVVASERNAVASERNATASERNAKAAEKFAQSAKDINSQTQLAVEQFKALAQSSSDAIKQGAKDAENAHQESERVLDIQTRTWVGITLGDLTVPYEHVAPHGKITVIEPTVTFTLTNYGETPAQNIWWSFDYASDKTAIPMRPFDAPQCKDAATYAPNNPFGINLFAHETSKVQSFTLKQIPLQATEILGCIAYQGVAENGFHYSIINFALPPLEHQFGDPPDVFHLKGGYFRAR